jgi:hypothetical protein
MKTQIALNLKLKMLCFLSICYINNPLQAQIKCESFKQVKTGENISSSYAYWVGGKADLWGNSFLDIFVLGSGNIVLASLQPESLYMEKYDAQLNLIKSKSLDIVMNKSRSYYGVTHLEDHIFILYTEKVNTGNVLKSTRLFAQQIDTGSLELSQDKMDLLGSEEEIEFEKDVPGTVFAPKAKVYIGFSKDHKYFSIMLHDQTKNDFALANFVYKVFNSDLSTAYEGNVSTEYKLSDLRGIETGISDDGEFALGIGVEKKYKKGAGDYITYTIYFTDKTNKIHSENLEDETGYSESVNFNFVDNKLFVDVTWQKFDDKLYYDSGKMYVFDITKGNKIDDFSSMVFDYLTPEEAASYGKEGKNGYNGSSKEFLLHSIQSDADGNIYLSYKDYLPVLPPGSGGFSPNNMKNLELGAIAYVKLDENFENVWAHLFYFSDWETNEILLENNRVHAFGNSYEKISAGADQPDVKTVYKSQVDAGNKGELYRYDITFNEKGDFEINELVGECKIPFKDYIWIKGDYFHELNSFIYYGRPEGKNQPGYLFKFGY